MDAINCKCGHSLRVPSDANGSTGTCPACKSKLRFIAPQDSPLDGQCWALLAIEAGPAGVGNQFVFGGGGPIEIGKLPDRHIRLPGEKVSRSHCRLVRSDRGWRIEDAGSRNGVFVDQRKIDQHELEPGNRIQIGEFLLRYLPADGQVAKPGAARRSNSELTPAPRDESLEYAEEDSLDGLYALSEGEAVDLPKPREEVPVAVPEPTGGPTCPSCGKSFGPKAKICVHCGVDLKTGRPILVSNAADLDSIYSNTERVVGALSWIFPTGLYPIASEAFGAHKPYFIRGTTAITILISLWVLVLNWSASSRELPGKDFMLWCGRTAPEPPKQPFAALKKLPPSALPKDKDTRALLKALEEMGDETPPTAEYRPIQLVTHIFIHGDLLHLASNMLFLLIFGSRVNALIGNIASAILYPLLGIAAGLAHRAATADAPPQPMIGASGAIMGLAGMYLVLMAMHKVHMAFRWRFGWIGMFRLSLKLFAMRGFWVVLFYIAFDVVFTLLNVQDNVAHWAHLGGFLTGAGIALILLLARWVNTRGGDLLSGLLGRYAWPLIGKPGGQEKKLLDYLP